MFENPGKLVNGGVCAAKGFQAGAAECGVKDINNPRLDLGLIYSELETTSAGVFTTNRIKAAPVKVTNNHVKATNLRAFLVNSGNANACTGVEGIQDAKSCAKTIAKALRVNMREVGVCSTGVIGLPLPADRMIEKFPLLVDSLGSTINHADLFSKSILTSDTRQKEIAVEFKIGGKTARIGACAKGAGMIKPSMATMLCFITTDVQMDKSSLQKCLLDTAENTFNRISIDGDMSTNDTALIMANGASGVVVKKSRSSSYKAFSDALHFVMDQLAREIVLDGEKVSKFVTLKVKNARSYLDAKKIAEAVANSPLVKSSWNGDDPNWGRVIHAVGYSRASIQEELIEIFWGEHMACQGGKLGPASISNLRKQAKKKAFELTIDMNLGESDYTMYTSDLSPEYVDYNRSEYSYWDALAKSKASEK